MAKTKKKRDRSPQKEVMQAKGYSDEDYIRVMALYNLYHNKSQVARETGISLSTIQRWITNARGNRAEKIKHYDQRLKQTQDRLMQTMGFVADEALQQVHKKLPEASAAQAATIYGILFDKQQIMAGNAGTTNLNLSFDMSGMSADDATSLMQRVLDRQRQSAPIPVDSTVISED